VGPKEKTREAFPRVPSAKNIRSNRRPFQASKTKEAPTYGALQPSLNIKILTEIPCEQVQQEKGRSAYGCRGRDQQTFSRRGCSKVSHRSSKNAMDY
jgi:hypothetical protein